MRGMKKLLLKVVDIALIYLWESREVLMATVKSQINLVFNITPTSFTNPTKKGFHNDATDILVVVHILRILIAYLKILELPCDWMYVRDILVIKSELLGEGLEEKGLPASSG